MEPETGGPEGVEPETGGPEGVEPDTGVVVLFPQSGQHFPHPIVHLRQRQVFRSFSSKQ